MTSRLKIIVLSTYACYPATYGGPVRILGLYDALSQWHNVTVLAYDCHAEVFGEFFYSEHLKLVTFPVDAGDMRHLLYLMNKTRGIFLHDILCSYEYTFSPAFRGRLANEIRSADVIICEQPYFYSLIEGAKTSNQIVVMSSQNCEYLLKDAYFKSGLVSETRSYLRQVHQIERASFVGADIVTGVSAEDVIALNSIYGQRSEDIIIVPNCSNVSINRPLPGNTKEKFKQTLGVGGRHIGIFLGSAYRPNVVSLLEVYAALKGANFDFLFFIVGTVADALQGHEIMQDHRCIVFGYVNEVVKRRLLQCADFAIHWIVEGSGTNLKLFDYMSVGLPIVTNSLGARGVRDSDNVFSIIEEIEKLPEGIQQLIAEPERMAYLGKGARRIAEEEFDWNVAAKRLSDVLKV